MSNRKAQHAGNNNPFSWDTPEDGKWWHYVSPEGVETVRCHPAEFGKDVKTEYPRSHALAGKRIIRAVNSRLGALTYERAAPGGMLLILDRTDLAKDEFFLNTRSGNMLVLGEAAARCGRLEPVPHAKNESSTTSSTLAHGGSAMITPVQNFTVTPIIDKIDNALDTLLTERLHVFQELARKYKAYRNLGALNAGESTDNTFPGFEANVSAELWEQLRPRFGDLNVFLEFPGIDKDKIDIFVETGGMVVYVENKMYYSAVEADYRNDFDKVRALVNNEDNAIGVLIHFQFYENRNKPAHALFEGFRSELNDDEEPFWVDLRPIGQETGQHFLRLAFKNVHNE